MKLTLQQVTDHLRNHLLPLYLITGNESLLVAETRDLIRNKSKQAGFSENFRYEITKSFDWDQLTESTRTLSLFSEQRSIELRLSCKLSTQATQQFTQFLEKIPADIHLILLCDKLEAATTKSAWYNLFNQKGAIITIWPIEGAQYLQWLGIRAKQQQLNLSQQSLQFLAEQTEGNLLASAQEIMKLALLYPAGQLVSHAEVIEAVTQNARYDLFTWVDTILTGNLKRTIKILANLRIEGIEPTLLLWALTREIRQLIGLKQALTKNNNWSEITKQYRIWDKRQSIIKQALTRHSLYSLHQLLLKAQHIDSLIKGVFVGNCWDELEALALRIGQSNQCIK